MLKEKLLEDLKDAMKTKNVTRRTQFKWLEQQYYKLKKTRE